MSLNYGVNIFFPIWLICSRIPDAWSIKLTFSLTITFYLIKTESRAKKVLFFPKNAKKTVISKSDGVLVLKGRFVKTT